MFFKNQDLFDIIFGIIVLMSILFAGALVFGILSGGNTVEIEDFRMREICIPEGFRITASEGTQFIIVERDGEYFTMRYEYADENGEC